MDKVWEIRDPDASTRGRRTVVRKAEPPQREEKDPAKAFSCSILVWGGGQLYNDQPVKGTVFMLLMLLCMAGTVLSVFYRAELLGMLRAAQMPLATVFLAAEALLFCVIIFWITHAGAAYQRAARSRRTPFTGVRSRVAPFLASLVIPGWGQFLNGQPLKGSIFSGLAVLGLSSLFFVVLTFLGWPLLEASDHRFIAEGIAAVALLPASFTPLLWALGSYDALKVSMDDLKKESLWERLKAAYYRGRTQGWVRGVFPQIKGTFLLALFLAFFVIVVSYWFPREFYGRMLERTGADLESRGMTLVPAMIEKAMAGNTAGP